MSDFQGLGKGLIIGGFIFIVIGLILLFSDKIPLLGKLPGDIAIKGKNWSFYFPLATSILLSILISLVLFVIRKLF
ncbi:hypothetical protein MYP_4842 [Sporocytophaga myxococcoides]|uniref:DUF2905 domain-containing protein n=1 Tax=Sporocytophaga myxococcoides TaxID=153721 RepID=A0A098LMH9_9BACT|nr:DUF2905 family protein [Sporocytophaga myxococcoides]GAL87612.1 hypothetical protein MYP_4842 [Sporocytophaga myxococcoides]